MQMLAFSAVRVSLLPYPRLKTIHLVVQRARRKAEDAPVRGRVVLVLVWFAPTRDVRALRRANAQCQYVLESLSQWSQCYRVALQKKTNKL